MTLWSKSDVNEIVKSLINKFRDELEALPQDMQQIALSEFLDQFNRGARVPFDIDSRLSFEDQKKNFFDVYESAVELRCISMKMKAREEIQKVIYALPLSTEDRNTMNQFLMGNQISEDLLVRVEMIQESLTNSQEHADVLIKMIESRLEWHNVDNGLQSQNTSARILSILSNASVPESNRETPASDDDLTDAEEVFSDESSRLSSASTKSTESSDSIKVKEEEKDDDDANEVHIYPRQP